MTHYGNNWTPINKYLIEGDVFDYGECRNISYLLTYLYISLAAILFIFNLSLFIIFIYKDHKNPMLKSSFYLCIMFSFISVILIPLSVRNILMVCYYYILPNTAHKHLLSWFAILYFVQLYLSWLLLFQRLHIATFDGTYKLNERTIIWFKILLAYCPIVILLYIIYLVLHELFTDVNHEDEQTHVIITVILFAFLMIFGVAIPILLAVLFVRKLMEIYKEINKFRDNEERQAHDRLVPLITRTTILAVISVTVTILTMISFFIHVVLSLYMGLLNICCNFICIMFAYQHFIPLYRKICCLLDGKCERICYRFVDRGSHRLVPNPENDELCVGVDGQKRHELVTNSNDDMSDDDEEMLLEMETHERVEEDIIRNVEIVENVNINDCSTIATNSMECGHQTESVIETVITKITDIETVTTFTA